MEKGLCKIPRWFAQPAGHVVAGLTSPLDFHVHALAQLPLLSVVPIGLAFANVGVPVCNMFEESGMT